LKSRSALILLAALAIACACEGPTFRKSEAETAGSSAMEGGTAGDKASGGGGASGGAGARGGGTAAGGAMTGHAGVGSAGMQSSGASGAAGVAAAGSDGEDGGSGGTADSCVNTSTCETCCDELYPEGHGSLAGAYYSCGCAEPCYDYCATEFCTSVYYWSSECVECMLSVPDINECHDAAASCDASELCNPYRACLSSCF
jgi:hypothetical protein